MPNNQQKNSKKIVFDKIWKLRWGACIANGLEYKTDLTALAISCDVQAGDKIEVSIYGVKLNLWQTFPPKSSPYTQFTDKMKRFKIGARCYMLQTKFNHHTHIRKTFTPISVRLFWSNFHEWRMSSFCLDVCRNDLFSIGTSLLEFLWETVEAAHPIVEPRLFESDDSAGIGYIYISSPLAKSAAFHAVCNSRFHKFNISFFIGRFSFSVKLSDSTISQ